MAVTVVDEGTQTATVGTEHSLGGALTAAGVYVLTVNLKNMVSGDEVILRAYTRVLTGDAQTYLLYTATYMNRQGDGADAGAEALGDVLKASIPVESAYEVEFTLTQEAGTSRDFAWRVDTI